MYLFLTSFLSAQIINHKSWVMYQPDIISSFNRLCSLGERAHIIWSDNDNLIDMTNKLAENFYEVDDKFLINVIDEILNSPEKLEKVTKDSYRNVLGFLKLVLISDGKSSWKLRVHIWDHDGTEDLHNHKWDFFSKVIFGTLTQGLYSIDSSGSNPEAILYSVREPVSLMPALEDGSLPCPCRDNYALSHKDSIEDYKHLFKISSTDISIGNSYFMRANLIHTINPTRDSVTFVFTSQQIRENSEVFLPMHSNIHIERHAPSVTEAEVREELYKLQLRLVNGY